MQHIEVVAAVSLRKIAVGICQVPLASTGAGVVTRRHSGIHPKLRHDPTACIAVMKISAHTQLLYLKLTSPPAFTRPAERVVLGMIQVINVTDVSTKFAGEHLGIKRRFFGAAVAVEPGEVSESEWSFRFIRYGRRISDLRCRGLWSVLSQLAACGCGRIRLLLRGINACSRFEFNYT